MRSVVARLLAVMGHLNQQLAYSDATIEHRAVQDSRVPRLVAAGGDIPALVTAMQNKQRQRETAAATVDRLEGLEKAAEGFDVGAWVEETRELLEDLLDTLEADPVAGRGCLRDLLTSPVVVAPVLNDAGRCVAWDYLGCGALDRVLAGRLPGSTCTEADHNHPPSLWEARG